MSIRYTEYKECAYESGKCFSFGFDRAARRWFGLGVQVNCHILLVFDPGLLQASVDRLNTFHFNQAFLNGRLFYSYALCVR